MTSRPKDAVHRHVTAEGFCYVTFVQVGRGVVVADERLRVSVEGALEHARQLRLVDAELDVEVRHDDRGAWTLTTALQGVCVSECAYTCGSCGFSQIEQLFMAQVWTPVKRKGQLLMNGLRRQN